MGDNTRAAVITRGLAELTRLGTAMGGEAATFAGLAGMGDLIATCMSPLSRNRTLGEQLGAGRTLDEALSGTPPWPRAWAPPMLVRELAERYGVAMPVCDEVYQVLTGEIPAAEAYRGLRRQATGRPRARAGLAGARFAGPDAPCQHEAVSYANVRVMQRPAVVIGPPTCTGRSRRPRRPALANRYCLTLHV